MKLNVELCWAAEIRDGGRRFRIGARPDRIVTP
jgi:hypothetical protein